MCLVDQYTLVQILVPLTAWLQGWIRACFIICKIEIITLASYGYFMCTHHHLALSLDLSLLSRNLYFSRWGSMYTSNYRLWCMQYIYIYIQGCLMTEDGSNKLSLSKWGEPAQKETLNTLTLMFHYWLSKVGTCLSLSCCNIMSHKKHVICHTYDQVHIFQVYLVSTHSSWKCCRVLKVKWVFHYVNERLLDHHLRARAGGWISQWSLI